MQNPKTTIAAALGAIALVAAGISKFIQGQPVNYEEIVMAVVILLQAFGLYKAQDPK